jgi:hypothetical protein
MRQFGDHQAPCALPVPVTGAASSGSSATPPRSMSRKCDDLPNLVDECRLKRPDRRPDEATEPCAYARIRIDCRLPQSARPVKCRATLDVPLLSHPEPAISPSPRSAMLRLHDTPTHFLPDAPLRPTMPANPSVHQGNGADPAAEARSTSAPACSSALFATSPVSSAASGFLTEASRPARSGAMVLLSAPPRAGFATGPADQDNAGEKSTPATRSGSCSPRPGRWSSSHRRDRRQSHNIISGVVRRLASRRYVPRRRGRCVSSVITSCSARRSARR